MIQQSIRFVDKGRRTLGSQIYDIIDYTFEVTRDEQKCFVNVGISGVWHDEIPVLRRKLSSDELIKATELWLLSRLGKGGYDPLANPELLRMLQIPSVVMDYYVHNWQIPDYI